MKKIGIIVGAVAVTFTVLVLFLSRKHDLDDGDVNLEPPIVLKGDRTEDQPPGAERAAVTEESTKRDERIADLDLSIRVTRETIPESMVPLYTAAYIERCEFTESLGNYLSEPEVDALLLFITSSPAEVGLEKGSAYEN